MTPAASSGGGDESDLLRIQVSPRPDCLVVTLTGELDLRSTAKLSRTLEAAATASHTSWLLIDMTHLAFIDSAGLGVLIHAENRAQARGSSIVLVHPPPLLRRLLTNTALQHRFAAYNTVDAALAAIRRSRPSQQPGIPGRAMQAWSVLVVDDEPAYRAVLSVVVETDTRLSLAGVADDGRAAIELVKQRCPDAIILDVQMPNMDGLTALPLLRQACPATVIAMYSSDRHAANVALDRGADLVADKSEAPTTLIDRVVELFSSAPGH